MASGMGVPSIGLYSWELFQFLRCGQHHPHRFRRRNTGRHQADGYRGGHGLLHGLQLCPPVRSARHLRPHRRLHPAAGIRSGGRENGIIAAWATCCAPTTFYSDGSDPPSRGRRWACWPWKWNPPAFYMNAARAGKRARCAYAQYPTICTAPKRYRPRIVSLLLYPDDARCAGHRQRMAKL